VRRALNKLGNSWGALAASAYLAPGYAAVDSDQLMRELEDFLRKQRDSDEEGH
jgi:hypothetical protein